MPSPTYSMPNVGLYNTAAVGDVSAPVVLTATYPGNAEVQNGYMAGDVDSTDTTGTYGFRVDLGSAHDITTHKYLTFLLMTREYGFLPNLDDLANGGMRVYLIDTSGNYAGYNVYGGDYHPVGSDLEETTFSMRSFREVPFSINPDRTADYTSATAVDLTDIQYVEVYTIRVVSERYSMYIGQFMKHDDMTILDGDVSNPITWLRVRNTFNFMPSIVPSPGWQYARCFRVTDAILNATTGLLFPAYFGMTIGDGATQCRFSGNDGTSLAWWPDPPSTSDFADVPISTRILLADNSDGRGLTINQSASCHFEWDNGNIYSLEQAGGENFLVITGNTSGSCTFSNFGFHYHEYITCGHGTFTNCLFNGNSQVEIDTNTTITGSSLENLPTGGFGIYTQSAPGDFSAIDVAFRSTNSGYDLVIDAPSAGTYDFTGITVDTGHTLQIRNESATNAITVLVPVGTAFTTSTAGGGITVQADVTVKLTVRDVTDNAVVEGARVRMVAAAGGSLTVGALIMEGTTDVNGEIQTTDTFASNQPFTAAVRKATLPGTLFKPGTVSGVINTASGLDQTALLIRDE